MSLSEKWQVSSAADFGNGANADRNSNAFPSHRVWGLQVVCRNIQVRTAGSNDVVDITPGINELIYQLNLQNGTVTLFVQGSSAGLTTIEHEPGAVNDLTSAMERLAPTDLTYQHETRWQVGNGHSHVRAALLGPSLVVPFANGQLLTGTWQQVVLVEFDIRGRQRDIAAQFIGG